MVQGRRAIRGVVSGASAFDLADFLVAKLSLGVGTWGTNDLDSFSMRVDVLGEATDLTYGIGSTTMATTVMGGVLNSSLSHSGSDTHISSGLNFDYLHQDTSQTFTVIPKPSRQPLAVLVLLVLLAIDCWRKK